MYYTWAKGQAKCKISYRWRIFEIGPLCFTQISQSRCQLNIQYSIAVHLRSLGLFALICPMFNFTSPPQRTTNKFPLFVAWSWAPEPRSEICDWLCPSISRYEGTMLNGAVSHTFVVFSLIRDHRPEPMSEICDWLYPSISLCVGTMLNGTVSRVYVCFVPP
jgi:hypothetical protein